MTYQQWKENNNPKKVVLIIEYFKYNFQKLIKFNVSQTDFGETLFLGTPGFKKMDEFSKYSSIFQNPDVP